MAYTPKTQRNEASIQAFLEKIENPIQQKEAFELLEIFKECSGYVPEMWGGSIIGYGAYHYVYASGQEGDWMRGGFSPRKGKFSLYIMNGFDQYEEHLSKLGKFKTGKSCLYISKLDDVDLEILKELISSSFEHMKKLYPEDR